VGRYAEGLRASSRRGPEAALARRVIAGYLSYAFHRVGEVTDTITGIDMILATGFNWAPPSVLVDLVECVRAWTDRGPDCRCRRPARPRERQAERFFASAAQRG
jgi:hypothetical protein